MCLEEGIRLIRSNYSETIISYLLCIFAELMRSVGIHLCGRSKSFVVVSYPGLYVCMRKHLENYVTGRNFLKYSETGVFDLSVLGSLYRVTSRGLICGNTRTGNCNPCCDFRR
ncbi:hypothetical protein CBL_12401 [Carabus blaptoides fortunei]